MAQNTADTVASVLAYLSTPVGAAPAIIDASKGESADAALGALQTLAGLVEVFGKTVPSAVGGVLSATVLASDIRSLYESYNDNNGRVEKKDVYSLLSDITGIVAAVALAGTAAGAAVPLLITTAVVATAAGAALTVMAMASDGDFDWKPAVEGLKNALNSVADVLGDAYTTAVDALGDAITETADFGEALFDYVSDSLSEIAQSISDFSIVDIANSIIEALKQAFGVAENTRSPLILDLDGDGVETISSKNGVFFDHDGNGFAEKSGWVGKDDGLLVWDRNGNGQIDNGSELFGNQTHAGGAAGVQAANGFLALKALDQNNDGTVDSSDSAFASLRVWVDRNSDGKLQANELLTLNEAGVRSLNVAYAEPGKVDANGAVNKSVIDASGNQHRQTGSFTRADGTEASMNDVWFDVDTSKTIDLNVVTVTAQIEALPDVAGFGNVHSLHQAMARDASGKLAALVGQFGVQMDDSARRVLLTQIIYYWTGVQEVDPGSRAATLIYGNVIGDARKLAALETFLGQEYMGTWCWGQRDPNPHGPAAALLLQAFDNLSDAVYNKLMLQTHFAGLIDSVDIQMSSQGVSWNIDNLIASLQQKYTANSLAGELLLAEFSSSLKSSGHFGQEILEKLRARGDAQADGFYFLLAGVGLPVYIGSGGNDFIYGNAEGNLLVGKAGDDNIYGGEGADKIYGGTGNDFLVGGNGADTYVFNRGDGVDTILNADTDSAGAALDVISFGEGISADDVILSAAYYDLVISIRGTHDRVIIQSFFDDESLNNHGYAIDEVRFFNGVVWTRAQLMAFFYTGTQGDDVLFGTAAADVLSGLAGDDRLFGENGDDYLSGGDGADIIWGGRGNDILAGGKGADELTGGRGSDTYLFTLGDGRDVISETEKYADEIDVIQFSEGISRADISLRIEGSDLLLLHSNGVDSITIKAWLKDAWSPYKIERVLFSDGSAWDIPALLKLTTEHDGTDSDDTLIFDKPFADQTFEGRAGADHIISGAGNDRLSGGDGDDVLEAGFGADILIGGKGDDVLYGGRGRDIFLFELGDGHDVVYDFNVDDEANVIRFGTGILPSEISVTRRGDDLLLTHLNGLDSVALVDWFSPYRYTQAFSGIEFSDGTVWSPQSINDSFLQQFGGDGDDVIVGVTGRLSQYLSGGGGHDRLIGGGGDDVLVGGTGNDALEGGYGSDTYLFSAGDGADTIVEQDAYTVDTLKFVGGILPEHISMRRAGTDLVFIHGNGTDSIVVKKWFEYNNGLALDIVSFDNGVQWTGSDISRIFTHLEGTVGNDVLDLSSLVLDQSLSGLEGDDVLTTGRGDDVLAGGTGNDVLIGGAGSDVYIFNLGDGKDVIYDVNDRISEIDILRFGNGISASDITLKRIGSDLVFVHRNGVDSVTVNRCFDYDDYRYRMEFVEFSDGTRWTNSFIASQFLELVGTDGNDELKGLEGYGSQIILGKGGDDVISSSRGNDLLNGGKGNDTLSGGGGSDTYVFELGDGKDIIMEVDFDNDVLRFGNGIVARDIAVYRRDFDLVLSHSNGQDEVLVAEWFSNGIGWKQLERIEFADGTVWLGSDLTTALLTFEGSDQDDQLSGVKAMQDQIFRGNGGNDLLVGFSGNDSLYGGTGNDRLEGGGGYDLLQGGTGSDVLIGGWGWDTYVFNLGDGADVIVEDQWPYSNNYIDTDTLKFGAGITASAIIVYRLGDNLIMNLANGHDRIMISHWFKDGPTPGYYQIEKFEFFDGTRWTSENIPVVYGIVGTQADDVLVGAEPSGSVLRGVGGSDQLIGSDANDHLDGGTGNDLLQGKGGSDIYFFSAGDGEDTIEESDSLFDTNSIIFAEGIKTTDVLISAQGDDLVIFNKTTADKVTVKGWGITQSIASIEFVNGVRWSSDNLSGFLSGGVTNTDTGVTWKGLEGYAWQFFSGGSGDDTIVATKGDDQLSGGKGNDFLNGGEGADTYIFNRGDGQDTVLDLSPLWEGVDILKFGPTINPDDLVLTRNGWDMEFGIAGTTDRVTVKNWFLGEEWNPAVSRYQIENIEFANGVVWLAGEYIYKWPTSGNDLLIGDAGNNKIRGGLGDDRLAGAGGSDTYYFAGGDGCDEIIGVANGPADVDKLVLEGISINALWFSRSAEDLIIDVLDSTDSIKVTGWYSQSPLTLGSIEVGNQALLTNAVDNLVNAMAAFGAPAGGEVTLTPSQRDQVNLVIAANWQ